MPSTFNAVVTTTSTSLQALSNPVLGSDPVLAREIQVEADAGNTLSVSWGDKTTQNMSLAPGERQVIPVSTIQEVYVKVAAGTENLHIAWIN